MLKRSAILAVPFAVHLALLVGLGWSQGWAQGIAPHGPAAVQAPDAPDTVQAPKDTTLVQDDEAKAKASAVIDNPQTGGNNAMTPLELIAKVPERGQLKNPYKDYKAVAEAGHKLYFGLSCNGCHGGGGGGGMCPPLTNDVWVYGSDDDTLFRLVSLGSQGLGEPRKGRENVKGPMPPQGGLIKSQDDLWKIISWIRTVYKYDPKGQPWAQP